MANYSPHLMQDLSKVSTPRILRFFQSDWWEEVLCELQVLLPLILSGIFFFFFFGQPQVVSSHADVDQYSAEYLRQNSFSSFTFSFCVALYFRIFCYDHSSHLGLSGLSSISSTQQICCALPACSLPAPQPCRLFQGSKLGHM